MTHTRQETVTEGWRALELFTNRIELCRLFCSYVNDEPTHESVLNFYGDGGNGKSLLIDYLRSSLCKLLQPSDWDLLKQLPAEECVAQIEQAVDANEIPIARLDFSQDPKDGFAALLKMRRDFSGTNLHFPVFDYAVVTYLHHSKQLTAERLRSIFPTDDLEFVLEIAELIREIPGASFLLALGRFLDRRLGRPVQMQWQRRRLDNELVASIHRMDHETELVRELPRFFAQDLNAALKQPSSPKRVALFFDTHEAFWGYERTLDSDLYFIRDEWLRRLVSALDLASGIVVVVAGREIPMWPSAPQSLFPVDALESKHVGEFADNDAIAYLKIAGVGDSTLRDRLMDEARVGPNRIHPFYLGLNADLALDAARKNKSLTEADLQLSSDTEDRIVARLLRYVDVEVRDAVEALAACRTFDRETYRYLGEALDFPTSRARFATLTRFSFIRQTDEGASQRYRVHELLRRILSEQRGELGLEAHRALERYFRKLGETGDDFARAEAIYHSHRLDWKVGISEWVAAFKRALELSHFSRCRSLLAVRDELQIGEPLWHGLVAFQEAEYFQRISRYDEAEAEFREAISAFDQAIEQQPEISNMLNQRGIARLNLGDLLKLRTKFIEAEASYRASIADFAAALARAKDDPNAHGNQGNALTSLGALLAQLGRYEESETSYRAGVTAFDRALDQHPGDAIHLNNRGISLEILADLLANVNRYSEAEASYRASISDFDRAIEGHPEDPEVINNRGNAVRSLANLFFLMDRFTEAEARYQESVADFDRGLTLAPDDPDMHYNRGTTLTKTGELMEKLGRYGKAELSYRSGIASFEQALMHAPNDPEFHNNRGAALTRLAELVMRQEGFEAAESILQASLEAFNASLEQAPDFIDALQNRASAYEKLAEFKLGSANECTTAAIIELLRASFEDHSRVLILVPGNQLSRVSRARVLEALKPNNSRLGSSS